MNKNYVDESGLRKLITLVKTELQKKYEKPSGGIPASDIATGVVPTVPTNVSAFTNDAGYLTQHQSLSSYRTASAQDVIDASKYEKPSGGIPASDIASGVIPTVPSNVSAFTNDAGYLTQHQDITGKQNVSISPISGMSANTVEGALSELNSDIVTLSNANNIDTTDEKVVGNYIYMDGDVKKLKPIYQKTFVANVSGSQVIGNIANIDIVLTINGVFKRNNGDFLCLNDYADSFYKRVTIDLYSNGNLEITNLRDSSSGTAYITIVHTKTTDTPTTIN